MPNGYLQMHRYVDNYKTKKTYVHREVWEKHFGSIPAGFHIHHKNGNKQDNRIENLELLEGRIHNMQESKNKQRDILGRYMKGDK